MNLRGPSATAIQLSARDIQGRFILSVLLKRTYSISGSGECVLDPTLTPLYDEPRYADDDLILEDDLDLWPIKPQTDVVVRGHVYNHPGKATFMAGIAVGPTKKLIAVFGDRRCTMGQGGRVLFSEPTVVEKLPLSYALAYGGRDSVAEEAYGNPVEILGRFMPPGTDPATIAAASPFFYPRNPGGRGYLVEATRASVGRLVLPNLEHPSDLLSPERIAAGETNRWAYQPIPASLGWLDYGAFPRLAWLGVLPEHEDIGDPRKLGEVRFGYCAPDILQDQDPPDPPSFEGVQGASLGLRAPHLKGGEPVELLNLTQPRETLRFRLPAKRPDLYVDGREGELLPTEPPVMHSVVVEPDGRRVTIVWRGSAPARRAYSDEELKSMPFAAEG
jgi:hypothetical protein